MDNQPPIILLLSIFKLVHLLQLQRISKSRSPTKNETRFMGKNVQLYDCTICVLFTGHKKRSNRPTVLYAMCLFSVNDPSVRR